MKKNTNTFAIFFATLITAMFLNIDASVAQMPLPMNMVPEFTTPAYIPAPVVVAPVAVPTRHCHKKRSNYAAVVPVQVNYPAYYAPQVPVVPMAFGPVPTMSAYYVPTAPVAQTYYAAVVPTRRARHFTVPVAPVAVVQPVYWLPY